MSTRLNLIDSGIDRDIDAHGDRAVGAFNRAGAEWFREVAGAIGTLGTDPQGRLLPRQMTRAQRITGRMLRAQGLNDASVRVLKVMGTLTRQALDGLEEAGMDRTLTSSNLRALDAFFRSRIPLFGDLWGRMAGNSAIVLRQGVSTGQLATEVLVEIREVLDNHITVARTLYETALADYVQMVAGVKAIDKGISTFIYSGPVDTRIRPFCLSRVGRVWTRTTIDKMDNHQLPNTFLTRGGYNCRHWWRPTVKAAHIRVADTGQVVEGMGQLVKDVARALTIGPRHPSRRTA